MPEAPPTTTCLRGPCRPAGNEGHQGNMTTSSHGHGDDVDKEGGGEGRLHSIHYFSSHC